MALMESDFDVQVEIVTYKSTYTADIFYFYYCILLENRYFGTNLYKLFTPITPSSIDVYANKEIIKGYTRNHKGNLQWQYSCKILINALSEFVKKSRFAHLSTWFLTLSYKVCWKIQLKWCQIQILVSIFKMNVLKIKKCIPIFPPLVCKCKGRGATTVGLSDLVGAGWVEKLKLEADVLIPVVEYGDWNVELSMLFFDEKLVLWDCVMPVFE